MTDAEVGVLTCVRSILDSSWDLGRFLHLFSRLVFDANVRALPRRRLALLLSVPVSVSSFSPHAPETLLAFVSKRSLWWFTPAEQATLAKWLLVTVGVCPASGLYDADASHARMCFKLPAWTGKSKFPIFHPTQASHAPAYWALARQPWEESRSGMWNHLVNVGAHPTWVGSAWSTPWRPDLDTGKASACWARWHGRQSRTWWVLCTSAIEPMKDGRLRKPAFVDVIQALERSAIAYNERPAALPDAGLGWREVARIDLSPLLEVRPPKHLLRHGPPAAARPRTGPGSCGRPRPGPRTGTRGPRPRR